MENLDDWNMLQYAGCDRAQGYFLAKPMAAEQMQRWLGRNSRAVAQ